MSYETLSTPRDAGAAGNDDDRVQRLLRFQRCRGHCRLLQQVLDHDSEIPVSPYYSQQIEDTYWEEERYTRVPILDAVEGENAPLFCLDPPSSDEVIRALPDKAAGGFAFLAETARNNIRIVVEPIVDRVDECRFYPLAGPARLHHCHYKCTVYYDKTIRSYWPVPFTHSDETEDVVYIDHDHLIRCTGPDTP